MSFGDCADDAGLRAAWKQFCQRLEAAGDAVFKDTNPALPLHRADGFRFLTQNLGQAFDLALETKNTKYPVIHAFCTPFCKLGGDNADYTYQQAWIDGESAYRISGNRGTSRFFNIAVQGARVMTNPGNPRFRPLNEPFGDVPEVNLFGHDMEIGWDGSFEVYIGGPKRGPNWLPTTPQSRKLFIRNGSSRADPHRAPRHERAAPYAHARRNGDRHRLGRTVPVRHDARQSGMAVRILGRHRSGQG